MIHLGKGRRFHLLVFKPVPSCSTTLLFPFCHACKGERFAPSLACGPPAFLPHDCIPPPWVCQVRDRPAVVQRTLLSSVLWNCYVRKRTSEITTQPAGWHFITRSSGPPGPILDLEHWQLCVKINNLHLSWDLQTFNWHPAFKKNKTKIKTASQIYRYKFEQITMSHFF